MQKVPSGDHYFFHQRMRSNFPLSRLGDKACNNMHLIIERNGGRITLLTLINH